MARPPSTVEVPATDPGMVYVEKASGKVVLFDTGKRRPTMHARAGYGRATVCRRDVFGSDWRTLGGVTLLRADHAVLFAKPCATCWP